MPSGQNLSLQHRLARGLVTAGTMLAIPFAYREITGHTWLALCYVPLLLFCTFRFTILSVAIIALITGTVMMWLTWAFVPWALATQTALVLWWGWRDALVRTPDPGSRFAHAYLRVVRWVRPLLALAALALAASALIRTSPWAECLLWSLNLGAVARGLSERRPIRWRSAIATALVLMVSSLIGIAIVEIGARQFVPPVPPPSELYMADPDTIFTLRPNAEGPNIIRDNTGEWVENSARTSSQGIRGPEYGPKGPDEFRIVLLGDSFTFGHVLTPEENVPNQLAMLLNAAGLPKRVTVINCGVGGFAPWQERGFLQTRGFGFEPDLVILQVFPANDVPGTLTRAGKRLPVFDMAWEYRLLTYQQKARWPQLTAFWLERHCRTYVALTRLLDRPELASTFLANIRFVNGGTVPRIEPSRAGNPNLEASRIEMYPELEEAWRMMEEDIRGIQADCRERNVDCVAFCHPFPADLLKAGVSEEDRRHMGTVYEQNLDVHRTREIFQRAGIPGVDVTGALESHPHRERLHFVYDGHFTAEGARVVANTLAEFLLLEYFPHKVNATSRSITDKPAWKSKVS